MCICYGSSRVRPISQKLVIKPLTTTTTNVLDWYSGEICVTYNVFVTCLWRETRAKRCGSSPGTAPVHKIGIGEAIGKVSNKRKSTQQGR